MTEERDDLPPDDAFTLLADPTRIKILRALGEASRPGVSGTLGFSELRRRADISGSGRFNYHLRRLVGQFVEETEDGYRLRYPGVRVYQAIEAGTFTDDVSLDPFDLDATCHVCGDRQEAAYDDCLFGVRCGGDCGAVFYRYFYPPNGLRDRDREAILRGVDERVRREIASMARGTCPWCGGRMATRRVSGSEAPLGDNPAIEHPVRHACDTCNGTVYTRLGDLVVTHPAVVSFFYEHAVDVRRRRVWRLPFAASDERTTVSGDEGTRATVRVECEGDALLLHLDDDPSVVDVERRHG